MGWYKLLKFDHTFYHPHSTTMAEKGEESDTHDLTSRESKYKSSIQ